MLLGEKAKYAHSLIFVTYKPQGCTIADRLKYMYMILISQIKTQPMPTTNDAGFANYHPGPVVNEKVIADIGSGMNVDSCFSMDPFCHHSGEKWNV